MRVFLTGATGFVGGNLARGLSGEHELTVLPRASDLRHSIDLALLPAHADVVIHAAGVMGMAATDVNVIGTRHVIDAARAMNAARLVLLSTGGVYGPSDQPLTEEAELAPQNEYAASKLAAEEIARAAGIRLQVLRLFFPYGPGQRNERLIPRLIDHVRRGAPVTNAARLNPIYIDDLVEWTRRLLEVEHELTLNIAGAEIVSVREIVEIIGRVLEVTPNVLDESGPSWIGNNSRVAELTGYMPRVSLEEGLRRTIATIA